MSPMPFSKSLIISEALANPVLINNYMFNFEFARKKCVFDLIKTARWVDSDIHLVVWILHTIHWVNSAAHVNFSFIFITKKIEVAKLGETLFIKKFIALMLSDKIIVNSEWLAICSVVYLPLWQQQRSNTPDYSIGLWLLMLLLW